MGKRREWLRSKVNLMHRIKKTNEQIEEAFTALDMMTQKILITRSDRSISSDYCSKDAMRTLNPLSDPLQFWLRVRDRHQGGFPF